MVDRFEPYRKQVEFLLREISDLSRKKTEIEMEMVKVEQLLQGNLGMLPPAERQAFLDELEQASPSGITDRVRLAYKTVYPKGLTPMQLRDALVASGVSLDHYSNPMSTIHSVIRRLIAAKEIEANGDPDIGGYRVVVRAPIPPSMRREAWRGPKLGDSDPLNRRGKD
jgi:hypothetical protein